MVVRKQKRVSVSVAIMIVVIKYHVSPSLITAIFPYGEIKKAPTTSFDMMVLNDRNGFHLVMDGIDRLPQTGSKGTHVKQKFQDKLIEHKHYINTNGEDMPEDRNWKWINR